MMCSTYDTFLSIVQNRKLILLEDYSILYDNNFLVHKCSSNLNRYIIDVHEQSSWQVP